MSWTFNVNNKLSQLGTVLTLKNTLVTGSWTVVSSSDGSTLFNGFDGITVSGSGAHGLANAGAWFILQSSGTFQRQLCVQVSPPGNLVTNSSTFRIKYSGVGKFVFTTGSATVTPSAVDEVILAGGGTDISPTYTGFFGNGGGSIVVNQLFHLVVGDASTGYSWYFLSHNFGDSSPNSVMMIDVMQPGSYPSYDPDPAVIYIDGAYGGHDESGLFQTNLYNAGGPFAQNSVWLAGKTTSAYVYYPQNWLVNVNLPDPYNNKDMAIPALWARSFNFVAPWGVKGISSVFLVPGTARSNMDTLTLNTTKDYLFMNWTLLPWAGIDPVIS